MNVPTTTTRALSLGALLQNHKRLLKAIAQIELEMIADGHDPQYIAKVIAKLREVAEENKDMSVGELGEVVERLK
ncbi:MAG: hypothetical protein AAFX87_04540 [Bacteroidota bacterium]